MSRWLEEQKEYVKKHRLVRQCRECKKSYIEGTGKGLFCGVPCENVNIWEQKKAQKRKGPPTPAHIDKYSARRLSKRQKKRLRSWGKRTESFYQSDEWKALRYQVIKKYGRSCMACGQEKGPMHVDHIKPRSLYPQLQLDFTNMQVLCNDCNIGKSNKDATDFRPKESACEN